MHNINRFISLGLLALILTFATSCKQKPAVVTGDALSLIPAEASNVSTFNPRQLMDKADFESIKSMDFFKDALKEAKENEPVLAAVMEDPSVSGIDLDKNAYLFTKMSPDGKMNMLTGVVFSLADASKFADMLKSADIGAFEKGNGFFYGSPETNSIVAWNDNTLFIGGGTDKSSLLSQVERFFKTSGNQSIANDPNLQKAFKGDHDIVSYANFDAYADVLPDAAKLQLGAMGISEEDLVGNNVSGFVDFNDGEIYSESNINLSKKIEKDINLLFNDKVKTDFSPYIPSEGLTSFLTFAMDIKGTNQLLKEKGVGGMVNLTMARYGLTADDLAGALGGDIMLAAYSGSVMNSPEMLFGTNIEDQDVLNKFLEAGKEAGILSTEGDNLYSLKGTSGVLNNAMKGMGAKPSVASNDAQLLIEDGKLFISSRMDIIAKIKDGGYAAADRIDVSEYNNIAKNIFGMYLNFNDLGKWSDDLAMLQFNDMEVKSGRKKSEMRLRTDNQNENSLKSIFKMMNEAYKKDKLDIKIDDKDKKRM